jgi:ATP:ADP antiporter, AAA family
MSIPAREGTPGTENKPGSLIYRVLRLFTTIYPGEAAKALLLFSNVFFLLFAYYIIKPVRDALILTGGSPEIKSYMGAAQAILLIFVVKAFSKIASKVARQILITWVTLFFISNLVLFYFLDLAGAPVSIMGIVFFVWIGIYNLLVPAQFWGFANDLYTDEAGKRLFPLIAFGATLGALAGSKVSSWLWKPLGAYKMMLVTAAILGLCIVLAVFIHKREIRKLTDKAGQMTRETEAKKKIQEQPLKAGGGFRLVFKSRYLLYIAIVIVLYNFINHTGEYIFSKAVTRVVEKTVQNTATGALDVKQLEHLKETNIGQFYSDYQFLSNLAAMIIQLFLVSRIFKWVGVAGALLIYPIFVLGGYGLITLGASLVAIKWVKVGENGTDYSLMNTTKQALYLITSREEKYKAKAAIDTFFVRGGDMTAAFTVFIGVNFLAFKALENYAVINVVAILAWISLTFLIIREYKKIKAKSANGQTVGS